MAIDSLNKAIEEIVFKVTGNRFTVSHREALGGGCINDAEKLTGADGRHYFIKKNAASFVPVFNAELLALRALAEADSLRVPDPIGICQSSSQAALILEFLPIQGSGGNWTRMGRDLARLHRSTAEYFGWPENNWIGSTLQLNDKHDEWLKFYSVCRLEPQIQWARKKSLSLKLAESLLDALPLFFDGYSPRPSLLHGDLWAGNAAFLKDGTPVVFDPASYYGDREADLALTELFGGYPEDFYTAYNKEWPLDSGYSLRKELYNLYHILNHFNIFGGGYGTQAESMIRSLLNRAGK